jgi:acyl carrier protein
MGEGSVRDQLNLLEQEIADVWATELGALNVSPESDFFELGGDSVSMVSMLLKVRDRFSIALPLGALFKSPTLREFSRVVAEASKETRSST